MNFRVTAVALAALVVLGGVVWFTELKDKGGASATPADKQRPEIFKFDDKVTSQLEVVKADQKVQVQKNDQGDWTLQPSGIPGDRVRISSVLSRLASLQATRLVVEGATDLSQHGLDSPTLSATVTQNDGTQYTLQTGAKAPSETAGTYVKRAEDTNVYLIPNQLVSDLDRLVTDPPIQQPTPTPAPIPSPSPAPEATSTPTG